MRTRNAVQYTLSTIFKIAFGYKVPFSILEFSEQVIIVKIADFSITFNLCSDSDLDKLLLGELSLKNIDAFDSKYKIPIVSLSEDERFYSYGENGNLIINHDIISLPFILLSNLDEYYSKEKDKFDRFQFKDSISNQYNLISKPMVDEYAFWLRKIIIKNQPDFTIQKKESQIITTHDIDDLYRFTGFFKTIKSLLGEMLINRKPLEAFNSVLFLIKRIISKTNDPYLKGIETLYEDSLKNGYKSVFFFMGAESSSHDAGQSLDDTNIKSIFDKIKSSGMEIGIHPGFYTFRDAKLLAKEIKEVEMFSGSTIEYSRQHYLRFDCQQTFDHLETCGISVDYTIGYAEQEGFRCGTAHQFNPYNIKQDKPYNLIERPLIAMDVTLMHYKKYTKNQALSVLTKLYEIVERTEGDFIILWHNAYVYRNKDWYDEVYLAFLKRNSNSYK